MASSQQRNRPRAGPPISSRKGESGDVAHNLYVKVVTGADVDRKSSDITVSVLKYIHARMPTLASMGLSVRVNTIRSQDLQNPRLIEARRQRGITRLPALTTPNDVYIGLKESTDIYEKNLKEFAAVASRGERPVEGILPEEDPLDSFYRDEMSFERADEDTEEAGLGEGDNMMDSYRHMMERRESSSERRPGLPGAGARPAAPGAADGARSSITPTTSARPDNIAPSVDPERNYKSTTRVVDAEDAEIQETIDRLARDIDDGMRNLAFTSGGGDSLDDEGGGADPQDDLMERAYWANLSESH